MLPEGVSGVVPVEQMFGDDADDTAWLEGDLQAARRYLLSQKWCFGIRSMYFGAGIGGVVAVFLAEHPQRQPIATDPHRSQADQVPIVALEAYVELMRAWVDLAQEGKESDKVFPVNLLATPENAEKLGKRLDALTATVIPWIRHGRVVQ